MREPTPERTSPEPTYRENTMVNTIDDEIDGIFKEGKAENYSAGSIMDDQIKVLNDHAIKLLNRMYDLPEGQTEDPDIDDALKHVVERSEALKKYKVERGY